ncbi:MAG: oligosaccharide flippase family protein [Oscillospiraceae bacterium]
MNNVKKIAKISLIYLIGQLGSKFISLIMLPIYTNYISPQAYGDFDVVSAFSSVIIPFFCLEVWSGMLRFALTTNETNEKRKIVNNSMVICGAGTIAILLILISLGAFNKLDNFIYVLVYFLTTILMNMTTISCRAFQENKLYAISGMVSVFTNAIASIICIFGFKLGIQTLYIAAIVSNLSQILLVEFRLKLLTGFKLRSFDWKIAKPLIKYCWPLSINTVFYFLLTNVNRVIISYSLPNADYANGIYAVANKLTVLITLLLSVFFMAWQETNYGEKDIQKRHAQCKAAYDIFIKIIGMGIIILLPVTKFLFPYLIGESYSDAYNLIPFFYLAMYFQAINNFTASFFSIENKTDKLIVSKIIGSVVNVGVIFALIYVIGLVASPIALLVSQIAVVLIQYFQYRKFINVGLGVKKILFVTLVFVLTSVVYFTCSLLVNIIVAVILTALAAFTCKNELKQIVVKFIKKD